MFKYKVLVSVIICLVLANAVLLASAQGGLTITVEELDVDSAYPDINAVVSVVNPSGVPIQDLTQEDFEALEDEQPLEVTDLTAAINPDQPIAVTLVLDLSGSAPLEDVQAAAYQFLDYLGPDDLVALIGFNTPLEFDQTDPFKEADFTTDKELIRGIIDGLTIVGKSAVYEGIYKGLLVTAQQKADRRAVIVMTDGHDTDSRSEIASPETPKTAAHDRHIPVFTVGIYHEDKTYGRNPDYLKVLASESGGRYQEASDPSELGDLFQNVVDQLRTQYQLTVRTTGKPDGKKHALTLRVTTAEGQAQVEQTVDYPPPSAIPQILGVQRDVNGELRELGAEVKGDVLLVPEIDAQNQIMKVEYSVDGELVQAVLVDLVDTQPTHERWEWTWNTRQLETGEHQVTIVAYDDAGTASPPHTFQIQVSRPGVYIPYVGEVNQAVAIAVAGGGFLLLLFIVALIVASRRSKVVEPVPLGPTAAVEPPGMPPGYPAGADVGTAGAAVPDTYAEPPTDARAAAVGDVSGYPAPAGLDTKTARMDAMAGPGGEVAGPMVGPPKTEILRREPIRLGWLIIQEGAQAGREFRLGELTSIGRTGESDIILDDPSVSRPHAKVRLRDDEFVIQDMGATNPTRVNGEEISRHQLADGDRVEIGRFKLVFKQIEAGETGEE